MALSDSYSSFPLDIRGQMSCSPDVNPFERPGYLLSQPVDFPLFPPENAESTASPPSPSTPSRSPVRVVVSVSVPLEVQVASAIIEQMQPRHEEFRHHEGCRETCVVRCSCLSKYLLSAHTRYSAGDLKVLFGSQLSVAWLVIAALEPRHVVKTLLDVLIAMEDHGISLQHVPPFIVQTAAMAADQESAASVQQLGDLISRLPFTAESLQDTSGKMIIRDSNLVFMRPSLLKRCLTNPGALDLLRKSFGPNGMSELLTYVASSEHATDILAADAMADLADAAQKWLLDVATLAVVLDEVKVPLLCNLVSAGFDAKAGFDFRGVLFKSLLNVAQHGDFSEDAVSAIQGCRKFSIFERMLNGGKKRSADEFLSVVIDLACVVGGVQKKIH